MRENFKFIYSLLKGSEWYFIFLLGLQMSLGLFPILFTWLISEVVGQVAFFAGVPSLPPFLMALLLSCTAVFFLTELVALSYSFLSDALEERFCHQATAFLLRKVGGYPTLELFDNSSYATQVTLAKQNINKLGRSFASFSSLCVGGMSLLPSFYLLYRIQWWVPLVLLVTLFPLVCVRGYIQKKTWNVRCRYGQIFKTLDHYEEILLSPTYAQDVRLYHMSPRLLEAWQKLYAFFFQEINKERLKGVLRVSSLSLLSACGVFCCFYHVTQGAVQQHFSIQELSFLLGMILHLESAFNRLVYNGADVTSFFMLIEPFLALPAFPRVKNSASSAQSLAPVLEFKDVSFSYENHHAPVLSNLSFCLRLNESLGLVGENGSGKTTLIKLICRFYAPASGVIYWNGQDIQEIPLDLYRARLGALFQNFSQFPLSVAENMNVRSLELSESLLQEALQEVQLSTKLSSHLQTSLSKSVEDGLQLSGGQWQRLALTRLLLNLSTSECLLLDEPTASLDPHAEHAIMELIQNIIVKKASLIVSHRLTLTRFLSRILVLEKGKLIEEGTHEELLFHSGAYARMFEKQKKYYV